MTELVVATLHRGALGWSVIFESESVRTAQELGRASKRAVPALTIAVATWDEARSRLHSTVLLGELDTPWQEADALGVFTAVSAWAERRRRGVSVHTQAELEGMDPGQPRFDLRPSRHSN